MRRTLSCLSPVCKARWAGLFSSYRTLASTMCVCVHAWFHIVLHVFGVSGILFTHLEHMVFSHLLSPPLFATVGQASARIIDSLSWSLFMALLTHWLVFLY